MLTPLTATETVDRARKALQSGRGAGLPELLKLIESLSTNLGEATISEIADLIEKDATVLSRVLTVANTIMHNPSVAPLTSIPQAIHQLGFHRVRSLAVSLMLVENTGGANPVEQREAAAQALCSGLLAQGCAQSLGLIDPELAFACAALRKFGTILLPTVSLELYREMVRRKKIKTEEQAGKECFGLTPLELSRRLLGGSKLPEEVMQSLRDCQPDTIGGMSASTYGSRLLGVSDFGGRLASLALDGTNTSDLFGDRTRALARQFSRLLPGVDETIEAALIHTDERIGSFTQGRNTSHFYAPGLTHIKARVLHKSPGESLVVAAPSQPAERPLAAPPSDLSTPEQTPAEITVAHTPIHEPLPTITSTPVESSPVTTHTPATEPEPVPWTEQLAQSTAFETQTVDPTPPLDPWVTALTFVRDSFGAHVAWMFTSAADGQSLVLTHGLGTSWQEVRGRAVLRPTERTVFGVCLAQRENVVIHNSTEASLATYLPTWFRDSATPPGAFILMPLLKDKRATGLVLIGWGKPQRIAVTAAQTEIARQVLASTSTA